MYLVITAGELATRKQLRVNSHIRVSDFKTPIRLPCTISLVVAQAEQDAVGSGAAERRGNRGVTKKVREAEQVTVAGDGNSIRYSLRPRTYVTSHYAVTSVTELLYHGRHGPRSLGQSPIYCIIDLSDPCSLSL